MKLHELKDSKELARLRNIIRESVDELSEKEEQIEDMRQLLSGIIKKRIKDEKVETQGELDKFFSVLDSVFSELKEQPLKDFKDDIDEMSSCGSVGQMGAQLPLGAKSEPDPKGMRFPKGPNSKTPALK
jgi:predicted  nucleic acid-binding Zn-ribbon protein